MNSLFSFLATILKSFVSFNLVRISMTYFEFAEWGYLALKIAYMIILIFYTVIAFPLILDNLRITIQNKKLQQNESTKTHNF